MATAVSNPASFSSVRSACSAEGYGSSTSFSGYNRGGGIVPDHANTAGVSASDAGLALSQFSGITIPSSVVNHTLSKSGDATGSANDGVAPPSVINVTTNSVTISTSNGVGPFTYSWSYVSGEVMTVNSSTAATTTFSNSALAADPATVENAVYRCTVTDTGNGGYSTYIDVNVQTSHYYSGP